MGLKHRPSLHTGAMPSLLACVFWAMSYETKKYKFPTRSRSAQVLLKGSRKVLSSLNDVELCDVLFLMRHNFGDHTTHAGTRARRAKGPHGLLKTLACPVQLASALLNLCTCHHLTHNMAVYENMGPYSP